MSGATAPASVVEQAAGVAGDQWQLPRDQAEVWRGVLARSRGLVWSYPTLEGQPAHTAQLQQLCHRCGRPLPHGPCLEVPTISEAEIGTVRLPRASATKSPNRAAHLLVSPSPTGGNSSNTHQGPGSGSRSPSAPRILETAKVAKPCDHRRLHWEPETGLLDRRREDCVPQVFERSR